MRCGEVLGAVGLAALGIAGAVLIGMLVWTAWQESEEWDSYQAEHHCVESDRRLVSSLMPMVVGKTTILMPQTRTQVAWRCDDGMLHWR